MRAINKGYKFHLGTELAAFGGKFDDLIFVKDDGQPNRQKNFLYLQAKHRLYEKSHKKAKNITFSDLINDNKGDFSLIKYFHSYRDNVMKAEGGPKRKNKMDCVICTNTGFDENDLIKNGIQLTNPSQDQINDLPREMLNFKPIQMTITEDEGNNQVKDVNNQQKYYYEVANFLFQCATNPKYEPAKHPDLIQRYEAICDTLGPNEMIIDPDSTEDGKIKFHEHFINGVKLSNEAKELRKAIVEITKKKDRINWKSLTFKFNPIEFLQKIPKCFRLKPIRSLHIYYIANVLRDCYTS